MAKSSLVFKVLLSVTWQWLHQGNAPPSFFCIFFLSLHILHLSILVEVFFPPVLCSWGQVCFWSPDTFSNGWFFFSHLAQLPGEGTLLHSVPSFSASLYVFFIICWCQTSFSGSVPQLQGSSLSLSYVSREHRNSFPKVVNSEQLKFSQLANITNGSAPFQ